MQRGIPWCPFMIAPIHRSVDDVQIGWGANCDRHEDEDHSLEFKKQFGLRLGTKREISIDEGRRLIKAWLMLGTTIDEHCPRPRTEHVFRTDARTCHYTEAQLDELCELLAA